MRIKCPPGWSGVVHGHFLLCDIHVENGAVTRVEPRADDFDLIIKIDERDGEVNAFLRKNQFLSVQEGFTGWLRRSMGATGK
jgi:hypothetical protein